jgi:1-phosphofructokinase family hexose kinase
MIFTVTLNPTLDRTQIVSEIRFNDVLRSKEVHLDWGGKGFNVSRSLKVLGMDSVALGFLGGFTGKQIHDGLVNLGIPTAITWCKQDTRTSTVIIEAGSDRYIKVNEPGPKIQEKDLSDFLEKVDTYLPCPGGKNSDKDPKQTWVLSGSLPLGVPPDIFATIIHRVQSTCNGPFLARAILDTSGDAFRYGLLARPYMIKPNRFEAESITGFPLNNLSDLNRAGAMFHDYGVHIVAISLAENGLFLSWEDDARLIPAPRINVGNPTGAGDALLAGLLYALEQGETLPQAGRFAVACGAAAAQGAGVGLPPRGTIELLAQLIPL